MTFYCPYHYHIPQMLLLAINSQEIINSAPALSDSKNASPIATALGSLRGRRRPDARRMAGQVPARDQRGILRLHD